MARRKQNYVAEDFLQDLEAYTSELRDLIETECEAFAPGVEARQARMERALNDHAYFARTYFPHYITTEPSEFHSFASRRLGEIIGSAEGCNDAWAAPRGEAKSTLVTQITPIWLAVRDFYLLGGKSPYKIIPIIMDSTEQAQTMLAAIKAEFESNPRLRNDFPRVCGAGRVWNVNVIITANNIKMQAFGAGKRLRGLRHGPHRPAFVILDDIENDENVKSKDQRDKTYDWVTKAVLPIGPPDGSLKVISINTILHYDSVANRLQNNPAWHAVRFSSVKRWPDRMDLWDAWEQVYFAEGKPAAIDFYRARQAEMDAGAEVSWPAMRPILKCMLLRVVDHHAFDCEYQNDPTADENAPFKNLHFWVQVPRDWQFFAAHDPSMGKLDKGRDPSASLVGAFDREHSQLDVVEARIARITPDAQIAQIIELQREYNCRLWSIETVQFQEFFATELQKRSAALGIPIPVRSVKPAGDKDLRILSIQPHVEAGRIRLGRGLHTLIEQLKHYPEAPHDDGPDALHMLWALCLSFHQQMEGIRTGRMKVARRDLDYGH